MSNLSLTNRSPSLTNRPTGGGGGLLKTRQTTAYHVGDDGDYEKGTAASYTVLSTGQFAGTTTVDCPHYAAATISFTAPDTIADAAVGLVTFLTNDTIYIHGSASNDGAYTISGGGGAVDHFHVAPNVVNEAAGAYITISKQAAPSNNCVLDNVTGLMWRRTATFNPGEKIGPVSSGTLNWFDAATCFTIHPAAADLQMMTTGIKIVGGAAELPRYFAGMIIDCSGFANAVNNLPGYRVTGVAVNGADLDITLWRGNNTLIAEAAAGARDIKVVCRSAFAYCAGSNAASYAGYTDWRIPNDMEWASLRDMEAPTARPNAVAFPLWNWPTLWSSTVMPTSVVRAMTVEFDGGAVFYDLQTALAFVGLVRG